MTQFLPLLQAAAPSDIITYYRREPMAAGRFAALAAALAARLPATTHVVNLCENRGHFLLAWVAACLRAQTTLLPPNQSAGIVADLARAYPQQCVLDDAYLAAFIAAGIALPMEDFGAAHWRVPADRVVALTFTSGSTGEPQVHPKTWATLTRNAQLAASEVLGGVGTYLVATVPAQHVYGLETSAIAALSARCAVHDGKPFFPQDVRAALVSLPQPRSLVTTPTHLRALLEAHIDLPGLRHLVSATAPLPTDLARQAEDAWGAPVFEIYGCTEAGVMARRRTVSTDTWETFPGGTMHVSALGEAHYSAPQLSAAVALQDVLELRDATHFQLRGRATDMIKVAGKRASLQDLTRALLNVAGVLDAVVFVPQADARPAALVVAPGLSGRQILNALAPRIDAAFLPRPLVLLQRLPRNEMGKLPQSVLLQALQQHRERARDP